MNADIAEALLQAVMGDATADDFPDHLGVLRQLATCKYDAYEQYAPGRQFIESLAIWLDQFSEPSERATAMQFVLDRLTYVSNTEMRHLVSLMARDRVPAILTRLLAQQLGIPSYRVSAVRSRDEFRRATRSSLFLGMSDGARIDQLRRASKDFSNEQFAMTYELSQPRAESLLSKLKDDLGPSSRFEYIFLVDDFSGSGRTILRRNAENHLTGRLVRFVCDTLPKLMGNQCPKIFIGLYLATNQALQHLRATIAEYHSAPWDASEAPQVFSVMQFTDDIRLVHNEENPEHNTDSAFDALLHRYYDTSVEDEHKGRVIHGYEECGLPLVLTHNTPNNSVYLLWGREVQKPLFPRFERHQSRLKVD